MCLFVLLLPHLTLGSLIMMFLMSCVGACVYYRQLGGRGSRREGGGEERRGDKSSLRRVYYLLSSMSHVESMHTKQKKPTV